MRKACVILSLLLALCLRGCGGQETGMEPEPQETAQAVTEPTPDPTVESLDLSGQGGAALEELSRYPNLRLVELGRGGYEAADLIRLHAQRPELKLQYSFPLGGNTVSLEDSQVDLSAGDAQDARTLLDFLPLMDGLRLIDLGEGDGNDSRIPWETIRELQLAAPQAELRYAFTLFGKEFDLNSQSMDLNHIAMDDEGALVKSVTACMPELRYLDMDFCEVSDESMAEIRDSLPNAEVVWRIWFGNGRNGGYSVRTDVERILASNPDKAGELNPSNTGALKYCTKVRYLDLGHNDQLSDISFCAYMPDLEVAILAMGAFHDLTPLANCPKLEYLEIQTAAVNDLRPLAGLKNLRHLNICYSFTLMDITPLYDLDLVRLYLGKFDPVPEEQIQEFRRRHPQCEVDTDVDDPTAGHWRYAGYDEFGFTVVQPRYELLREQFHYGEAPLCYAYLENDPLYEPHG